MFENQYCVVTVSLREGEVLPLQINQLELCLYLMINPVGLVNTLELLRIGTALIYT